MMYPQRSQINVSIYAPFLGISYCIHKARNVFDNCRAEIMCNQNRDNVISIIPRLHSQKLGLHPVRNGGDNDLTNKTGVVFFNIFVTHPPFARISAIDDKFEEFEGLQLADSPFSENSISILSESVWASQLVLLEFPRRCFSHCFVVLLYLLYNVIYKCQGGNPNENCLSVLIGNPHVDPIFERSVQT